MTWPRPCEAPEVGGRRKSPCGVVSAPRGHHLGVGPAVPGQADSQPDVSVALTSPQPLGAQGRLQTAEPGWRGVVAAGGALPAQSSGPRRGGEEVGDFRSGGPAGRPVLPPPPLRRAEHLVSRCCPGNPSPSAEERRVVLRSKWTPTLAWNLSEISLGKKSKV